VNVGARGGFTQRLERIERMVVDIAKIVDLDRTWAPPTVHEARRVLNREAVALEKVPPPVETALLRTACGCTREVSMRLGEAVDIPTPSGKRRFVWTAETMKGMRVYVEKP